MPLNPEWTSSDRGQQSFSQLQYPEAWEYFSTQKPTLDRALNTRQLLMNQGLSAEQANEIVAEFQMAMGKNPPYRQAMATPPPGFEEYHRPLRREEWPERFYHVAPASERENILQNGLDATGRTHNFGFEPSEGWAEGGGHMRENENGDLVEHEWRPEGIYMWDNPEDARDYQNGPQNDIWEIDPQHLGEVLADPSQAPNWDYEDDRRGYFADYVPPQALRRTASSNRIYRGLHMGNMSAEKIDALIADPAAYVQQVLRHEGIGIHWTTNSTSAYNFATNRDIEGWVHEDMEEDEPDTYNVGILVEAEAEDQYILDPEGQEWQDYSAFNAILDPEHGEQETTVRADAPLHLIQAEVIWEGAQGEGSKLVPLGIQATARTAKDDPDPEYSFMYYKSAIEVVPWTHNVRYREIAQRLLNKFNTRLEDGGWKDDEGEWSGGDIYVQDDGLRVEFKHLADPEIQSSALQAIRTWYDNEMREKSQIDWEMEGEETRKESTSREGSNENYFLTWLLDNGLMEQALNVYRESGIYGFRQFMAAQLGEFSSEPQEMGGLGEEGFEDASSPVSKGVLDVVDWRLMDNMLKRWSERH